MRAIQRRLQKLEGQSMKNPRFFLTTSKTEADDCYKWIRSNYPNWPEGSYWIIYDNMPPKENFVRGVEPPWGWGAE